MPWQFVLVRAYVPARGSRPYPDQSLPGPQPYPDQGLPGPQPYPDQGLPGPQPYPDQGLPGWQPYPDIGFPGNQPYPDQGLPGNQPIIWPRPRPPYVDAGFPAPQPPWGARPTHPIYYPPSIWDPRPPYVDIGFPGPQPGGPVYPDQSLPGAQPYPDQSLPPVIDIGQMPEHPELPDLNAGTWMYVNRMYGTLQAAFVPWPLAVTHPDYNPRYPEQGTPGEWVVIVYGGRSVWAWIPSQGGESSGGDQGNQGEQQRAQRASKAASTQ